MGNLYTKIIRKNDKRIEILSRLRQELNCFPRDYDKIKRLQIGLEKFKTRKKELIDYGVFGKHTQNDFSDYKNKISLDSAGKVGDITVSEPSPEKDKKMHSDLETH